MPSKPHPYSGTRCRPKHQSGYIVLSTTVLMAVVILLIVYTQSDRLRAEVSYSEPDLKQAYLARVRSGLEKWYGSISAAAFTGLTDTAPDGPTILENIGQQDQYNVQFKISAEMTDPAGARYHYFAVWLPQPDLTVTFDEEVASEKFEFLQPPRFGFILSGKTIHVLMLAATESRARTLAATLESWFRTKQLVHAGAAINDNYFRATNCDNLKEYELPCVNNFDAAGSQSLLNRLGLSDSETRDPWGAHFVLSNDDPNDRERAQTEAPYSMQIRTESPWGRELLINVFQPL
jgi:hypothetical protein